jgi:hypothetical protein
MFEAIMLLGFLSCAIAMFLPAKWFVAKTYYSYIPTHRRDWK